MNIPGKQVFVVLGVTAALVSIAAAILAAGACAPKSDSLTTFMSLDCTQCHGGADAFPVKGARAGYDVSGHATLGNSFYSNGAGCQTCHTHEGFVAFLKNGPPDPKAFVDTPSQPGCFTCHDPHATGDFSLRAGVAVKLDNGKTFDAGAGNLCAACHRVRGDASRTVQETDAARVSPNFGPHHGPQADMLAGTNAFEYPGKTYANGAHTAAVKDGCIACHMELPEGRYGLSPSIGSHSFSIKGDVHGHETLNTAGCIACHPNIGQTDGGAPVFNKPADTDYDQDGRVEPLQLETRGLLDMFVNRTGSGLLQRLSPPMYKPDGSWNQVGAGGRRSLNEMAALYNYKYVLEDRSLGVHNASYAIQILYDAISSLKPGFDDSRRPK